MVGSQHTVGLTIALISNFLVGVSFVVKKQGLLKMERSKAYSYLKEPTWWIGMITMTVGEIGNFAAYAKAPAFLVTPLGAVAVFVNAFLSHIILKEYMSRSGHIGMLMCVAGTTLIMVFAPEEKNIENMLAIEAMMDHAMFKLFIIASLTVIVLMIALECRTSMGERFLIFYILLCSTIGSLLVICIKGLGVAIVVTYGGSNQFSFRWQNRLTYYFLVATIMSLVGQINFLNRALDTFGASRVVPVYYVTFTTFTLIGAQSLFRNLEDMDSRSVSGLALGCAITFAGVFLVGREVAVPGQEGKTHSGAGKDVELDRIALMNDNDVSQLSDAFAYDSGEDFGDETTAFVIE